MLLLGFLRDISESNEGLLETFILFLKLDVRQRLLHGGFTATLSALPTN